MNVLILSFFTRLVQNLLNVYHPVLVMAGNTTILHQLFELFLLSLRIAIASLQHFNGRDSEVLTQYIPLLLGSFTLFQIFVIILGHESSASNGFCWTSLFFHCFSLFLGQL